MRIAKTCQEAIVPGIGKLREGVRRVGVKIRSTLLGSL